MSSCVSPCHPEGFSPKDLREAGVRGFPLRGDPSAEPQNDKR